MSFLTCDGSIMICINVTNGNFVFCHKNLQPFKLTSVSYFFNKMLKYLIKYLIKCWYNQLLSLKSVFPNRLINHYVDRLIFSLSIFLLFFGKNRWFKSMIDLTTVRTLNSVAKIRLPFLPLLTIRCIHNYSIGIAIMIVGVSGTG